MRRRLTFALLFSATALYGACDNDQMVPAPALPLSEDGLTGKQESPAKATLALDAAFEAQAQALPAPGNAVDMPAPAPAVQKAETAPATEGVIEAEIIEDVPAARGESEPIPGGATGRG